MAEQQVFNFFVNGTPANDITNPGYGGANNNFAYGGFASYRGPGQGPQDASIFPGGKTTQSSGPGAISEASAPGSVGTQGNPVIGSTANDAYDGYGGIGLKQNGNIVLNYAGLTVTRTVDVTHGPAGQTTPITAAFTKAGVPNAARWVETVTNNTGATITGTLGYFNNLGSDSSTAFVASSSGNLTATSGNLYLTSLQNSNSGSDPVDTQVFGNNAYTLNTATMNHADGDDNPEWDYPISIAPGQTINLALFSILTAGIDYQPGVFDPNNPSPDVILGGQLADLITNNGQPIAADSNAFSFFTGLSYAELSTMINYDFTGLTIDTSRPFFIETDFAAMQSPSIFDGGTLEPTTSFTFAQPFTLDLPGGTVDDTNGTATFSGQVSGVGALTVEGAGTTVLASSNTYTGGTTLDSGTLELAAQGAAGSIVGGEPASGGVAFAAHVGTLRIDGAAFASDTYAAPVTNFATGDTLDLSGLVFAAGATASLVGTTLTVTSGGASETLTDFELDPVLAPAYVTLTAAVDGTTGTDVTLSLNAPSAPALGPGQDNGTSSTDNVTSINDPTFVGTALPNGTVTLYDGATVIGTGLAGADGSYAITPTSALADGTHSITATVADSFGDISAASAATAVTINTASPPTNSNPTPPSIAFDPTVTFSDPNTATLTGTVSDASGVKSVEIFEGSKDLGSASVNAATGTWAFAYGFPPGFHTGLSALATGNDGLTASASSHYDLTTGVTGAPYAAYQDSYDPTTGFYEGQTFFRRNGALEAQTQYSPTPDGGFTVLSSGGSAFRHTPYFAIVDTYNAASIPIEEDVYYKDGHQTVSGLKPGQTLDSISNDTFYSRGGGNSFVFTPHFGDDTITSFVLGGQNHDTISLPDSAATKLGAILNHATMDGQGDTTLHLNRQDSITIQGVSVAELKQHRQDFTFHA